MAGRRILLLWLISTLFGSRSYSRIRMYRSCSSFVAITGLLPEGSFGVLLDLSARVSFGGMGRGSLRMMTFLPLCCWSYSGSREQYLKIASLHLVGEAVPRD